jgi:prevent-host-death family protein
MNIIFFIALILQEFIFISINLYDITNGFTMKATAKDLRFYSKELLDSVSRGEEVIITYRGKPCARLVPISSPSNSEKEESKLFGLWKDNDLVKDVDKYVRQLRAGRF